MNSHAIRAIAVQIYLELGLAVLHAYHSDPCQAFALSEGDCTRAWSLCGSRQASCPICVTNHSMAQVGDQDRGYLLELMLTKLRYAAAAVDENRGRGIQIVGMSATLSNAQDLAQWLSAQLYQTVFRPVELRKYVKVMPGKAVNLSAGAMICSAYGAFSLETRCILCMPGDAHDLNASSRLRC